MMNLGALLAARTMWVISLVDNDELPSGVLMLNGNPLTLNGKYLILGGA